MIASKFPSLLFFKMLTVKFTSKKILCWTSDFAAENEYLTYIPQRWNVDDNEDESELRKERKLSKETTLLLIHIVYLKDAERR
jgi:hypothetical protein